MGKRVGRGRAQLCLESLLVAGFVRGARAVRLDQWLRTGEATGVARQDVCATASHGSPTVLAATGSLHSEQNLAAI